MKILKLVAVIFFEFILLQNAHSQDRLFFKSGKELPVVIEKETTNEIYFVKTAEDNTRFMILKSDLKQINYANGDSIVFTSQIAKPVDSVVTETAAMEAVARHGTYNCWIYGNGFSGRMRRGFINSVTDSGIVFSVSATGNRFFSKDWQSNLQQVSNIEQIKILRKGSVGKGILIGAGVGFFLGGTLGLMGIPNYGIFESVPPAENAMAGGIVFSIPGMLIGGIVGSIRMRIPLHKDQQRFEKYKKIIESYSTSKLK